MFPADFVALAELELKRPALATEADPFRLPGGFELGCAQHMVRRRPDIADNSAMDGAGKGASTKTLKRLLTG